MLTVLETSGDVPGALLAYQQYEQRLAVELDTQPAGETRQLIQSMRHRRRMAYVSAPTTRNQVASPKSEVAEPARAQSKVARRTRTIVMGLGLAALTIAGLMVWKPKADGSPKSEVRTIAVFPFALHGGSLVYLREGMVDLMSAKLDGVAGLRAIDPRSVVAAVSTETDSLEPQSRLRIARKLGAGWYVTGEVVEVAGQLQLNAALHEVSDAGTPAVRATVSGDTTALFDLVDDLTGQALASLVSGQDTALSRLAALTTHSLPALKAFLEGERALRAGLDAQSAAAFREAVRLDTTFALAEYRLAVMSTWVTVPGVDPRSWATLAARHARRLAPLVRDLLTAHEAYRRMDASEAERLYLGVTQSHPDNIEARFMLAETRFHYGPFLGRDPMDSRADFERVLELDPANSHSSIHLARLAALDGRQVDLDSMAHRYVERYRDTERTLEIQALESFLRDDVTDWQHVAVATSRADAIVALGVLQAAIAYSQNLDAAQLLATSLLTRAVANEGINRFVARFLSDGSLAMGKWDAALPARIAGALDADWALEGRAMVAAEPFFHVPVARIAATRDSIAARHPYRSITASGRSSGVSQLGPVMQKYLLGLLKVRMGDTASARQIARDLTAVLSDLGEDWGNQLSHALRAEIARSRGDLSVALAELDHFKFTALTAPDDEVVAHWGTRERFLRAELLFALGRDREALSWYRSLSSEWLFAAPINFRQGQIYQRLGDGERARFYYGRFIKLWKDCDPSLRASLDQAQLAMASLGSPANRHVVATVK
jgi:tetratricopeptide (TPR) repeat protein/TolB-like protein